MATDRPLIVGAGLAGLIAAHHWPRSVVVERGQEPSEGHRALLRFRSTAVSELVRIPFLKVVVRKGIWSGKRFHQPCIRLANIYSLKVTGRLLSRSIWDLEPVVRWVAPPDLYWRLVEGARGRVHFNQPFNFGRLRDEPRTNPVISTAPIDVTWLSLFGSPFPEPVLFADIHVKRFKVADAAVNQTIYYPSGDTNVYRASITNDLLIIESRGQPANQFEIEDVLDSFGIYSVETTPIDSHHQKYGKIAPISEAIRRGAIRRMTVDFGLYSLGRFATWRNILLDDVVNDCEVIQSLFVADVYDSAVIASKGERREG